MVNILTISYVLINQNHAKILKRKTAHTRLHFTSTQEASTRADNSVYRRIWNGFNTLLIFWAGETLSGLVKSSVLFLWAIRIFCCEFKATFRRSWAGSERGAIGAQTASWVCFPVDSRWNSSANHEELDPGSDDPYIRIFVRGGKFWHKLHHQNGILSIIFFPRLSDALERSLLASYSYFYRIILPSWSHVIHWPESIKNSFTVLAPLIKVIHWF